MADRYRSSENGSRISEDRVFSILSSKRRRDMIRYLEREGGTARLSEIAEHIARNEFGDEEAPVDPDKAVYVSLYQSHVPKMEDMGVIEYESDTKQVSLTERSVPVLAYLHFDPEAKEPGLLAKLKSVTGEINS